MKKFAAILIALLMPMILFSCKDDGDLGKQTTVDAKNGYTLYQGTGIFRMKDDEKLMKKLDGVQKDGFKTNEGDKGVTPISKTNGKAQVLELAKKEVDEKYNSVRVAFDKTRGIWRVIFGNDTEKEVDGKKQIESTVVETVYVDEGGYTLIVYKGEVK